MIRTRINLLSATGLLASTCFALAQSTKSLIINGKVASKDLRTINGRTYVPLADIAKAYDLTVSTNKSGNMELAKKGGSGPIDAKNNGKVDDWLFDGGWRIKLTKVFRAESYKTKSERGDEFSANEGEPLVIAEFMIRNGNTSTGSLSLDSSGCSLASADGTSIEFVHSCFTGGPTGLTSQKLLPGAATQAVAVFRVPKDFKESDLVLVLADYTHYDSAVRPKKPSVFRISFANE